MMRRREDVVVPASVDVEEASRRQWDVVVAGAGPAGAVVARQSAIHGARVLLVDKAAFPRWKVCGCCLNRAALDTLATLGLDGLTEDLGARRLSRLLLAVGRTRTTLPVPRGVALSREALDAALIREAVGAGAAFLPETEAVLLPESGATRCVRLRSRSRQASTTGRVVVAADGLGGSFLRMTAGLAARVAPDAPIGAGTIFDEPPPSYEPGTIHMACGRGVYVGAVRLEDGRLDVAAALSPSRLRGAAGIGGLLRETLEDCRFPVPDGWAEAEWRGTPALTRARARVANHRLFVVGDAAGYVEPFTGEGMSWAVQTAALLVPHVMEGLERWDPGLTERWETRYRRFFRTRARVCHLATRLLRHRLPARATVASLDRAPWLASAWMRRISTPDSEVRAGSGRARGVSSSLHGRSIR